MPFGTVLTRILLVGIAPGALMLATPALAQSTGDLAELRAQILEMKAEQQRAAARIAQLEAALNASTRAPATAVATTAAAAAPTGGTAIQLASGQVSTSPARSVNPAGGSSPGTPPPPVPSKLTLNGDLRVRYEANFGDPLARNRDRGVIRARLRAAYAVNNWLAIGGRTGHRRQRRSQFDRPDAGAISTTI